MVEESIYDKFVEASVERAKKRTVGNPFDFRCREAVEYLVLTLIVSATSRGRRWMRSR